jgi:signal transduction histidine kinase/CheY-like chemotaxis protein
MGAFDLLAGLTARLASTTRLDEIADAVVREIVELGFGTVWMAVRDEATDKLSTVKSVRDGVDAPHERSMIVTAGGCKPLDRGFRERRMINILDPSALPLDEPAAPHAIYDRLRGHPFACGPLLDSHRQPVGALGLSSYRGSQPIPDAVLSQGPLPAFMALLAIAVERARHVARVERLDADLASAREAILGDAPIKVVGELAASAAHDLNNLSEIALLGVGAGLRSPAEAFDMLPRIERANRAIGDLVRRLQRIARALASDAEAADLQQIADDVLIMAAPKLRKQSIEVEADLPAVSPVRCDAVLLHQIVLNLLVNAHDALGGAPPERRRIKISVREGDGVVRLVVADRGPGIAPEALAHLFDRPLTTKGHGHLGLGLFTAHSSLQPFGGRIEGRNAPDGGAVFEVTLVAAPPGTLAPAESARPAVPGPEQPRRARILVIDDDPDILYVIRANLEPPGHEAAISTEPAQAIELAKAQVFDIVLCDLEMPKQQSGRDVCRALREAGYRGKLVLMTGYDIETLRVDPKECDMLLKKPFGAAELLQVIETLLKT